MRNLIIALFILTLFNQLDSVNEVNNETEVNLNPKQKHLIEAKFPFSYKLLTVEGDTISSSELTSNGQFVLIDYWTIYCGPCIKMLDAVTDNYKEWRYKTNFKLIAIAPLSNDDRILELIKKKKWPFEFYFDPDYNLLRALIKHSKKLKLGRDYEKNYITLGAPQIFAFSSEWKMLEKLDNVNMKANSKYRNAEKNNESITSEMFDVNLEYYYKLYDKLISQ